MRGRADCAKKTASGLRGRPGLVDSYRLRASTISPHTHAAGVPDPVKRMHEYQYSTNRHLQSGETTSAPPPPFRSCRVCSRPCPSFLPAPVVHPRGLPACVWHGDCLIGMGDAINIENIHAQLAGRLARLASRQAIRLPNARNATRPLAADPTSGQPSQPWRKQKARAGPL